MVDKLNVQNLFIYIFTEYNHNRFIRKLLYIIYKGLQQKGRNQIQAEYISMIFQQKSDDSQLRENRIQKVLSKDYPKKLPPLQKKAFQQQQLPDDQFLKNKSKNIKITTLLAQPLQNLSEVQNKSNFQEDIQFSFAEMIKILADFSKGPIFQYIYISFLILFLANTILQTLQISSEVSRSSVYISIILQIIFTISLSLKFINYYQHPLFWLILQTLANICGYTSFILSLLSLYQANRYLSSLRSLRLFLFIHEVNYLNLPATRLLNSLTSVGKILFPAAMFIYMYAVIGLYSFRDYQYSKCRDPQNRYLLQDWTVYTANVYLCGEMSCPIVNKVQYQCLNPIDFGVQPNQQEVINIMQGNGLMKYNNIFFALFSTFKQMFITGSSRLMLLGKQVLNPYFTLAYYLSFCYLLGYIYLNIFYGLMMSNEEQSDQNQKKRSIQMESIIQNQADLQKTVKHTLREKTLEQIKQTKKFEKIQSVNNSQPNSIMQETCVVFGKKQQLNYNNKQNSIKAQKQQKQQKQQNYQLPVAAQKQNQLNNQYQEILCNIIVATLKQRKKKLKKCNSQMCQVQQQIPTSTIQMIKKIIKSQNTGENHPEYKQIISIYYYFNHVMVILCAINVCIQFEGQSQELIFSVDCIDFFFFWLYCLQIIFRYYLHRKYVKKMPFTLQYKLDLGLFVMCAIGMIYQATTSYNIIQFVIANNHLSEMWRTIKYLRVFILLLTTPFFNQARIIFKSTLQAVYQMKYFALLWFLIAFVQSVIGYYMFHGQTKLNSNGKLDMVNGKKTSVSLEGLGNSIIFTAFAFFNQEWDWFLFQQYLGSGVMVVLWQCINILIGLQIMSKCFMALLMNKLGQKLDKQQNLAEEQRELSQDSETPNQLIQNQLLKSKPFALRPKRDSQDLLALKKFQTPFTTMMEKLQDLSINQSITGKDNFDITKILKSGHSNSFNSSQSDLIFIKGAKQSIFKNQVQPSSSKTQQPPKQWIQKMQQKFILLLKSRIYNSIRIIIILISIICTLIMIPSIDPLSTFMSNLKAILFPTVIFFGFEIIISVITFGLFNDRKAYLKNALNWIYLVVFVGEVLNFVPGIQNSSFVQSMLAMRMLRILVFVEIRYNNDRDMRITIISFGKLLPRILNLLAITLILYGFFAIILVKIYKDDFYYCDGYDSSSHIDTAQDCFNWGGSWVQRKMNCSNFFQSLLYLFLLATTQGWSTQVIQAGSLRGQGMQPIDGANPDMYYFFSAFFFFGNMIMLNVFLGLSVYNFKKIKEQVTGFSKLSKDDKQWLSIKNQIYRMQPLHKQSIPNNPLSQMFSSFKHSRTYKIINVILFLLFMISMSLFQSNMSQQKQRTLNIVVYIFIGIVLFQYSLTVFVVGAKIVRLKKFWVETTGVGYILVFFIMTNTMHIQPRVSRALHGVVVFLLAARYFALLTDIPFINKMINSLITILPQTSNIWLLVLVVLLIYANFGIQIFSYLRIYPQINAFDQNYTSLDKAIFALIKFSIMQSPLGQIMDAASKSQPNGVCFQIFTYEDFAMYGRMGCGSKLKSYLFFLSFQLVYSLILMSTLMAVIFDAYSQVRRQQQSIINKFQLQEVRNQWVNYDHDATGYITYRDFWMFTGKLIKIYNVNKESLLSNQTKHSFLKSLQIPTYEDQNGILSFEFHEVIQALTRIVLKQKKGNDWNTQQAEKQFKFKNVSVTNRTMKRSVYDSSHVLTLILLKSGLKNWRRKAMNIENSSGFVNNIFTFNKKERQKSLGKSQAFKIKQQLQEKCEDNKSKTENENVILVESGNDLNKKQQKSRKHKNRSLIIQD